jgi:hypothetical protein
MKTNTARSLLYSLVLLALAAGSAFMRPAFAAVTLTLSPATVTMTSGTTTNVDVVINTDGQQSTGMDAVLQFAASNFDVVSITNGGFYPDFSAPTSSGRIEIHALFTTVSQSRSGTGKVATIQLKAKNTTGTGDVAFVCSGNGTDTQIYNTSYTNILSCSNIANFQATFTTTAPVPTNTTAPGQPTATPTAVPPTPTSVPNVNSRPSCTGLSSLPVDNATTAQTVTLTCGGTDRDGYINAADFFFGDGSSVTITKNAGSPGSISATHKFASAGTYSLGCRVKDNTGATSDLPVICSRSITIKKSVVVANTPRPYVSPKPGVTEVVPTEPIAVATLEPYVSPTPVTFDFPTPEPTVGDTEPTTPFGIPMNWIIALGGIALLLIIIIVMLIRAITKKDGPPPIIINETPDQPSAPPQQY